MGGRDARKLTPVMMPVNTHDLTIPQGIEAMEDKKTIQSYINNFRRHLAPYLKPGVGLACKVFPAKSEGAILEFYIGPEVENEDTYMSIEETVNTALKKIEQRMFGGNLDGIKFGGTNISMEPNRIILIKGENTKSEWNDQGAKNDAKRILATPPTRE